MMRQLRSSVLLSALVTSAAVGCSSEADSGTGSGAGTGGSGGSTGGSSGSAGSTGSGGDSGSASGSGGASGAGGSGAASGTGAGGTGGTSPGGSGGASGVGGSSGAVGSGGSSGSSGSGGGPPVAPTWPDCPLWPASTGDEQLSDTENVSGTFDGGMKRYVFRGGATDAIFELDSGATLKNVIIAAPGADGIHCQGNCTLQNVWWEDVGEDAATFEGSGSSTRVTIDCGGARKADDKVFQHNGGGTVVIKRFFVQEFGKLYRSCGNCGEQYERHTELENVIVKAPGDAVVGVNENYNDTAIIRSLFVYDPPRDIHICERYTGNDTGAEPPYLGTGPDSDHCQYAAANVFFTRE